MSGVGCVAMLTVNFLFVPRYGYTACAWGGFVGYGICVALSYLIGQRHYKIPYPIGEIALYFAVAIIIYLCAGNIQLNNPIATTAVRCTLLIPYAALVWWKEIRKIKR